MIVNVRPSYPKMYSYTIKPSFDSNLLTTPDGYYGIDKVTVEYFNKGLGYIFSPSFSDETKSFGSTGVGFIDIEKYSTYELELPPSQVPSSTRAFNPSNFPSKITVGAAPLQKIKVVYPSNKSQKITPSDGYWAMSAVTVRGAKLETKNAAPITADDQVITPSSGYYGLGVVNVPADNSLKVIRSIQQVINGAFVIANGVKMKKVKTFAAFGSNGIDVVNLPYAFYGNTTDDMFKYYTIDGGSKPSYTFNDMITVTDEYITINMKINAGQFNIFIIGT